MSDTTPQNPLIPRSELLVEVADEKMEDWDWETFVGMGMEARSLKDISQWVLGKLALGISKKYGQDKLGEYAKEIGVDKKSLSIYRWVVRKFGYKSFLTVNFLPFQAFKVAAGTENPEQWIDRAQEENWSASRLTLEIIKDKGIVIEEKPTMSRCPYCDKFKLIGKNICQCGS